MATVSIVAVLSLLIFISNCTIDSLFVIVLALFADIISAAEAEAMGLVNRVLPDAELDAFVDDWARRLAAGPPIAMAMSKRLLNNAMNVTMEEALDDEGMAQTVNFGTKDTIEAMTAFLQKRNPNKEFELKFTIRRSPAHMGVRMGEHNLVRWLDSFIFFNTMNGEDVQSMQASYQSNQRTITYDGRTFTKP